MPYYTGVGSRETPPEIILRMRYLASRLGRAGWTLRSGGADGADTAFEQGAKDVDAPADIYLPWSRFNGNKSPLFGVSVEAMRMASTVHPAWQQLSRGAKTLHARNCYQVLGRTLNEPSVMTICWTSDGCESAETRHRFTGGTATAIVLSERHKIPVFNLGNADALDRLDCFLSNYGFMSDRL